MPKQTVTTPDWQFYREGLLVSYPESEFRKLPYTMAWSFNSSELGSAAMIIDQLWGEIDRLRNAK